jgi:hypothetical protein
MGQGRYQKRRDFVEQIDDLASLCSTRCFVLLGIGFCGHFGGLLLNREFGRGPTRLLKGALCDNTFPAFTPFANISMTSQRNVNSSEKYKFG